MGRTLVFFFSCIHLKVTSMQNFIKYSPKIKFSCVKITGNNYFPDAQIPLVRRNGGGSSPVLDSAASYWIRTRFRSSRFADFHSCTHSTRIELSSSTSLSLSPMKLNCPIIIARFLSSSWEKKRLCDVLIWWGTLISAPTPLKKLPTNHFTHRKLSLTKLDDFRSSASGFSVFIAIAERNEGCQDCVLSHSTRWNGRVQLWICSVPAEALER